MKFKVSTIQRFFITKDIDWLKDIYGMVVRYDEEIDLSCLKIGEYKTIVAVKNYNSFEKTVFVNRYQRIK